MKQLTYPLSLTLFIAAVALCGLGAHSGAPEPDVPIGSIIAWHKSITGTPALPSGWVECNGTDGADTLTVNDPRSPLFGQLIPNLNGGARFLRGSVTGGSGDKAGSSGHVHTYAGTTDIEDGDTDVQAQSGSPALVAAYGHIHAFAGTTAPADHQPPYFTVIWIMRIK